MTHEQWTEEDGQALNAYEDGRDARLVMLRFRLEHEHEPAIITRIKYLIKRVEGESPPAPPPPDHLQ